MERGNETIPKAKRRVSQKRAEPLATALKISSASRTPVYRHQPWRRPKWAIGARRIVIRMGAAEKRSNWSGRLKSKRSSQATRRERKISPAWKAALSQER